MLFSPKLFPEMHLQVLNHPGGHQGGPHVHSSSPARWAAPALLLHMRAHTLSQHCAQRQERAWRSYWSDDRQEKQGLAAKVASVHLSFRWLCLVSIYPTTFCKRLSIAPFRWSLMRGGSSAPPFSLSEWPGSSKLVDRTLALLSELWIERQRIRRVRSH